MDLSAESFCNSQKKRKMKKSYKYTHPEMWKFLKFNICVFVTSALDIITYLILIYYVFKSLNSQPLSNNALLSLLGIKYKGYLFSYLISTSLGYIAAYLINRKITFHSDINPVYSSFLYFVLAVLNILISSWIGGVFSSFMVSKNISNPVTQIISKFIIINIPTIWTYPAERYIIQINKKKKSDTVIVSDLDGTLLNSNTQVTQENLDAIKRLRQKGVKTAILTGRTLYEIPFELRTCDCIDYFVYSNGAGIQSGYKGLVYYNPIDKNLAQKVFDILDSYDTLIEIYSNNFPFVEESKYNDESFNYYKIDKDFIPEMKKSRRTVESHKALLSDENYKIEMFDVFFENNDERLECKEKLFAEFPDLEITTSMTNNLEIMNKSTNKGSGLKKLCEISGYSLDDVIVVGDSKNDITAFVTAKKKYAVSNACKEIKSIADKIICSNDENIMCYMEKEL